MPQMERLKLRNRWLYTGTNYRRMVEPLDIAEYYKNGSRNYMAFRPNHHTLLEKWLVEDQQDRQPNGRTNETTSLTNDSCFWVYVEEAVLSLRDLEEGGSTQSVTKIEQGLAGFEANVQRALAVCEEERDEFAELGLSNEDLCLEVGVGNRLIRYEAVVNAKDQNSI
ncbi:senescence-associated carboxylesterase 101-like protein, partial [Tanacetum coccineum]